LRRLGAGAAIAAALAVAAVYVTVPRGGKFDPACAETAELAATLEPFATGEVAAFQPSATPVNLSALDFIGPDGQPGTLADLSGRTVLLNLWATWCVPCREEMPALDRLEAAAGDENFVVLALNVDRPEVDTQRFLDQIEVTLPNYADPDLSSSRQLPAKGFVTGLPTTLLIGEDGCELGVMRAPAVWDSPDAMALVEAAKRPSSGPAAAPPA
jgi:thiol-disulfide isomerase/thioredoxin